MSTDPDQPETTNATHRRSGLWSREFTAREIGAWIGRWKIEVVIGVGVGLRLIQYGYDRPYWQDEGSLVANVRAMSPSALFGPLEAGQLAPPGFLVAEWAASRALGDHPMVFRLIPLICGIASLFLIAAVGRRVLRPGAVWVAVAMFAVSEDLVYFASEAKQYSSDVAAALGCLLLALTVGSRRLTAASAAAMGAAGAAVVWFSHPSVFVLAAVGTVGLIRAIVARDGRSAAAWVGIGLVWVGSFAGVHAVAMEQLGHRPMMWRFWAFAFPPVPPMSAWDATWAARRFALLFVNPLNFDSPFGPRLSMLPAIGLCLIGFARFWREDRGRLALLVLPGIFALLASYLRLYPFHGRLVLFLVPSLLLAIAAGLDDVVEARGRGLLFAALAAMVLGFPALNAAYHVFVPIDRQGFNTRGDRRPQSLDPSRFPF